MAYRITKLITQQADQLFEKIGPAKANAYDANGEPTAAALGFARSCKVAVEELLLKNTEKGECLVFQQFQAGKQSSELMPLIIEHIIQHLPLKKAMRWGKDSYRFIRPVRSIFMMYGKHILSDIALLGLRSASSLHGHHLLHPQVIHLAHADDYQAELREAFVIAEFAERKQKILNDAFAMATHHQLELMHDEILMDEVTGLVEWPQVMLAHFSNEFLQLPPELLIASLRDNQKCFALIDPKTKEMTNKFIFVSNIISKQPETVIHGNERVVHARFADAAFFYEQDCKQPLENFCHALQHVIFQDKLGTLFDKTHRIKLLACEFAKQLNIDVKAIERVADYCKYDLVSSMVGEFPELQGIMGKYLAERVWYPTQHPQLSSSQQLIEAQAIEQHYWPRVFGDKVPVNELAYCVGLADKLDTLMGNFAIGNRPTGDKDPYSLRRTGLSIVSLLIECKLPINLNAWVNTTSQLLKLNVEQTTIINFILDRATYWWSQHHPLAQDAWLAAINANQSAFVLNDIVARAEAIDVFRQQSTTAESLIAANKRVRNILQKADLPKNIIINSKLFEHDAEHQLFNMINQLDEHAKLIDAEHYTECLQQLTELRPPLDQFFDHVMVMVDNAQLRNNRLALLQQLRQLFLNIGDFSLLNG